jgi:hypothetical protein
MIKRGISHPFFFGNVTNRGKVFKPCILQINQIHIIIFHQGYKLANIPNCFKKSLKIPKSIQNP